MVVGQREEACDELEAACECIILQLDGHTLRLGIKVDLAEIVASFFQCSFKGWSIVRRYKALQQKELLISKALPLESRTAEGKAVLQQEIIAGELILPKLSLLGELLQLLSSCSLSFSYKSLEFRNATFGSGNKLSLW